MIKPGLHTQPQLIKELNRYFWFEHGVFFQALMDESGSMRKNTAAQVKPTLNELSVINNRLGLRLVLTDFKRTRR